LPETLLLQAAVTFCTQTASTPIRAAGIERFIRN
jgi:hypothetical protein